MNALFEGKLSDVDMLNYARTIKEKVMENAKVVDQVNNNTKEQAMMGGFSEAINDAVIDSLDVYQNLATQVFGEERIRTGFANIVYELIAKGLKQVNGESTENMYEPELMVAEPKREYGKKDDK